MSSSFEGRLAWADLARISAIAAMVSLHVSAKRWYYTPVDSAAWQAMNLYDSLSRWCVPIFFMLSGMVQLDPRREVDYRKIFFRMLPRLLLALFFWNAAYGLSESIVRLLFQGKPFSARSALKVLLGPLTGRYWYHLWFIYAIAGLYLITPYLRKIEKACTRSELLGLISIMFVVGSVFPFIAKITGREFPFKPAELSGFAVYFLTGRYLVRFGVPRGLRLPLYILGITSLSSIALLTSFVSRSRGVAVDIFYDYLSPFTFLASISIFSVFRHEVPKLRMDGRLRAGIAKLAEASFAAYLVHDFFNQLLAIVRISTTTFNTYVAIPLFTVVVSAAAFSVALAIRKIPLAGKWIS